MNWLWKLLVWIDIRINDKWLGGYSETISGRCFRSMATRKCCLCQWLCKALSRVDPDHCRKAYFADRNRDPSLPWV